LDCLEKRKGKLFTTEPKNRRHTCKSISGNRLRDFLESCYRKRLFRCRYAVLVFEFITHFQTNDPRIYERYLGRPESIKRYSGSNIVRLNRQSGKIAKFDYMNERTIEAKLGLAQFLGWITFEKEICILHHEKLGYSQKQTTLATAYQSLENEENKSVSNAELCVSGLYRESVVLSTNSKEAKKSTREEEESHRNHTHKSVQPKGIIEQQKKKEADS